MPGEARQADRGSGTNAPGFQARRATGGMAAMLRVLARWAVPVVLAIAVCPSLPAADSPARQGRETAAAGGRQSGAVIVNLRDYARGDGSDETEAIQKAFAAFNVKQADQKGYEFREERGVLFIPAPPKFYGVSRTIAVTEKANLAIRCETPMFAGMSFPAYFQWLGPDAGEMFFFNFCWALRIENLSLSGNGKKVTGIQICDVNRPYAGAHPGAFKQSIFDHLTISDVGTGVKLGMDGSGADLAFNSFRDVHIDNFSEYGFISATGNGGDNTVSNLMLGAGEGAKEGVRITGGQLVILNSCLGAGPSRTTGAAVAVYAGGVNIYGTWSEWRGPFLYGNPQAPVAGTEKSDSNARFNTILIGIHHYPGSETQFWRRPGGGENAESMNPVPVSIDWDFCEPLTLINCSFWGGVKLGPNSRSPIIDIGTTFSNRDGRRFYGEGIEKYGRLVQVGSVAPDNVRAVEPYIVDRRNTPGTEPPRTGAWKKGDCIRNTDPEPAVPAKAWAGWICIEAGEPGTWAPFGRIGTP
jgi:hypothetical protein